MARSTSPRGDESDMRRWFQPAVAIAVVVAIGGFFVHEIRSTRECMSDHVGIPAHAVQAERNKHIDGKLSRIELEQKSLASQIDHVDEGVTELLLRIEPRDDRP
jgi:hypothetical protein